MPASVLPRVDCADRSGQAKEDIDNVPNGARTFSKQLAFKIEVQVRNSDCPHMTNSCTDYYQASKSSNAIKCNAESYTSIYPGDNTLGFDETEAVSAGGA